MSAQTTYSVVEGAPDGVVMRGAAKELWLCKDHEVIISGPAETGKTYAALHKLDALLWKYPRAQAVIVRKTYKSTVGSVLQTFANKVACKAVRPFGAAHPEWYDYPNGSRLWVGGMDNSDKVLSSERDFVYVNQAEELELSDWETLATRCTGRAGNSPYAQLFGDCNPSVLDHWIRKRAAAGALVLLRSRHQDNPALYDAWGNLTEQGERSLAVLDALTGVRRKRLLEGEWATAEGAVYEEFARDVHVARRTVAWRAVVLGVDEGYTNPGVILAVGVDGDGRVHVIEEFCQRHVLQGAFVMEAQRMARAYHVSAVYVDPSAAGLIAEMRSIGLPAIAGNNEVTPGIQAVKATLAVAGDGKPRFSADPSCVNLISEFESYIWKENDGSRREEPEKMNDHTMDALRYAIQGITRQAAGAVSVLPY
ncbi:MAG: terminase large subunit [bacterium]